MHVKELIPNYVGGQWNAGSTRDSQRVVNPATQEELGEIPLSGAEEVAAAVEAA